MKVYNPSDETHTLKIFPRQYVTDTTLTLRDERTKQETEIALDCEAELGYLTAEFAYTFVEGQSLEMTVKKADKTLLYRGKAYATVKTDLPNYTLTNE